MGGFVFQVACLRLAANEPLFGVYAVPVDWAVLRQNLRVVEVHMVSTVTSPPRIFYPFNQYITMLTAFKLLPQIPHSEIFWNFAQSIFSKPTISSEAGMC